MVLKLDGSLKHVAHIVIVTLTSMSLWAMLKISRPRLPWPSYRIMIYHFIEEIIANVYSSIMLYMILDIYRYFSLITVRKVQREITILFANSCVFLTQGHSNYFLYTLINTSYKSFRGFYISLSGKSNYFRLK